MKKVVRYKETSEHLIKAYEKFGRIVLGESIHKHGRLSFRKICVICGVMPQELDSLLLSEIGMTGAQLVAAFRRENHIMDKMV